MVNFSGNTFTSNQAVGGGGGVSGSAMGTDFYVMSNAQLSFVTPPNVTVAVSGVALGTIVKAGSGTVQLTAEPGSAVTLNVTDGTMIVDGPANGPTTVSGGTLSGNSTLLSLENNGVVHPGHSIGEISIIEDYVQGGVGNLMLDIDSRRSSQVNITQTASLDGILTIIAGKGPYFKGKTYTLLNAGEGVSGRFSDIVIENDPGLTYQLEINQHEVELVIKKNIIKPDLKFHPISHNANVVFNVLENATMTDPDLEAVMTALFNSPTNGVFNRGLLALQPAPFEALSWATAQHSIKSVKDLLIEQVSYVD